MRAVSRIRPVLLAVALGLAPSAALAQEAPPTTNTPAPDTVGPRELQNFNLPGTVTRQAEQPAPEATQSARSRAQPQTQAPAPTAQAGEPAARRPARQQAPAAAAPAPRQEAAPAPAASPARTDPARQSVRELPPASAVTVPLPSLGSNAAQGSATAVPASSGTFAPPPETAGRGFPALPWILAALVLAAGGILLLWRNGSRQALAGGPQVDSFAAPEPVPAAPPRAAPFPPPVDEAPKPPPTAPRGLVSTRTRPWLEIGFEPVRCVLDEQQFRVEFAVELFNSGNAPARAVVAEARLFNAGPAQDAEIGQFFAAPRAAAEPIDMIPPLRRLTLQAQVSLNRESLQLYEVGGRQVFIPLIAFNAHYRWGEGEGQTSSAYLLGRDTGAEKLAPFRLDLGPRIFRGTGARLLPVSVRK